MRGRRIASFSLATAHGDGARLFKPWILSLYAAAHSILGKHDESLAVADRALASLQETNDRAFEAEVFRIRGDILVRRNQPDDADAAGRAIPKKPSAGTPAATVDAQYVGSRSRRLNAGHPLLAKCVSRKRCRVLASGKTRTLATCVNSVG